MNKLTFKNFSTKALVLATASLATLTSCSKDNLNQDLGNSSASQSSMQEQVVEGQYIVVMKEESSSRNKQGFAAQMEQAKNLASNILEQNNIKGIKISDENTFAAIGQGFTVKLTKEQVASLKNDGRIAYIEEDRMIALGNGVGKGKNSGGTTTTTTGGSTDTGGTDGSGGTTTTTTTTTTTSGSQPIPWGVSKVGGPADGTGKTAWIIDSGIDPNHPDLNVDGSRSKSFLTYTQAGNYTSWADELGHGTQIAGIIGAKNNDIGVVGVAPNASLVSLRVMDANGSAYTSKIIAALNHVAYYGKAGDVVNFSIGGGISSTLDDAVLKVAAKGIFIAIASGNNAGDCINNSPARVNATNVYTVSAMDESSIFASFANYGSPVDYTAPGVGIATTNKGGGYITVGGTSYSAPHMAGVLLVTGGRPSYSGYVSGDKDGIADKIVRR